MQFVALFSGDDFECNVVVRRDARTPLRVALVNNRAAAAKILRAHGGVQ
jgi:hypothetical protein